MSPRDIDDEIDFHLDEMIDRLRAEGMSEADARAEAERRFGSRRRHTHDMLRARTLAARPRRSPWIVAGTLANEVRMAIRALRRSPGYVATVILTLALVIGANITMFGIADGLISRPLKYLHDPGRVHRVYWQFTSHGEPATWTSTEYTRLIDLEKGTSSFDEMAAFSDRPLAVGDGESAVERRVAVVSGTYFRFFDARPVLGRFFTPEEDVVPRGADVVVLGYGFWKAQFGGRNVIGEILRVGNVRATIVGVAPEGFDGLNDGQPPAAFMPITTYAASTGTDDAKTYFAKYRWGWVHVIVRRKPDVSVAQAEADASAVFRSTWDESMSEDPRATKASDAKPRVVLSSMRIGGGPSPNLNARTARWMFSLAALVLLIGSANVANAALARSVARRQELSIRLALGIGRGRLMLTSAMESVLLAVGGGLAALVVSHLTRAVLTPFLKTVNLPPLSVFTDARALTAAATSTAAAAILIGIAPTVLNLRRDLSASLRTSARGGGGEARRARTALIFAQVMLSVVLLVGALLFVRSLQAVKAMPMGYDATRVLLVNRVIQGDFDPTRQLALRDELLRTAQNSADVASAAWVLSVPFLSTSAPDVFIDGREDLRPLGPFTFQAATADYFKTMGTRILRGRPFSATEDASAPLVAVVSDDMAKVLWPGADPIGQCFRVRLATEPCRTVIGVAENMVQREMIARNRPSYYVPISQYPRSWGNWLVLKLRDDPARIGDRVRAELQRVMPGSSYVVATPLATVVSDAQASWRMGAAVLVWFGALALVVAAVGLYGTVSYDVTERANEWAVRMALGADRGRILSLVVGRAIRVVVSAVASGFLLSAVLGHWLQPLLFETPAINPGVYSVVAASLILTAVVACAAPALRASAAEPSRNLRDS